MKTATRGHGTITKRMEKAGLAYEVTDPRQIVSFVLTGGGPWISVAQWSLGLDSRVFVGFYRSREEARAARDRARRVQGVVSSRVIQVDVDTTPQTDPRNAQPTPSD